MSIKLKYLLPLLILVFAAVINLISYVNSRALVVVETEKRLVAEIHDDLAQAQGTVEHFLNLDNIEGVRRTVSAFGEHESVNLMLAVDENGIVLASTRYAHVGRSIKALDVSFDEATIERLNLSRSTDVRLVSEDDEVVGYSSICGKAVEMLRPDRCGFIFVQANIGLAIKQEVFLLQRQAQFFGIGTILMTLALIFIVHYVVSHRAHKMLQVMAKFAEGNRGVRIGFDSKDELGKMSKGVDLMLDRIVSDEAGLKANEARLRALFDTVPDGIVTLDSSGMVLEMNEAVESMLRASSTELNGRQICSLFVDDKAACSFDDLRQNYLDRKIGNLAQFELARLDESVFPAEIAISEMQLDDSDIYLMVVHDITERHNAEQKLLMAQKIIKNASEAIIVTNVNNEIVDVNPAYEQVMGYSKDEVLGKNISVVSRLLKNQVAASFL